MYMSIEYVVVLDVLLKKYFYLILNTLLSINEFYVDIWYHIVYYIY